MSKNAALTTTRCTFYTQKAMEMLEQLDMNSQLNKNGHDVWFWISSVLWWKIPMFAWFLCCDFVSHLFFAAEISNLLDAWRSGFQLTYAKYLFYREKRKKIITNLASTRLCSLPCGTLHMSVRLIVAWNLIRIKLQHNFTKILNSINENQAHTLIAKRLVVSKTELVMKCVPKRYHIKLWA